MEDTVVILAGGKGTRLKSHLGDLPKPLVQVGDRRLLEYQLDLARRHSFREVVLLLGYGADKIQSYLGTGAERGVNVRYVVEPQPRGTAGAVLDALKTLPQRFLLLYGDTMLNVDLRRFFNSHLHNDAHATLFVHPNDHPHDSDLVEMDELGRIRAFHPYPHDPGQFLPNLVNAALYAIDRDALEDYRDITHALDFGKHLFPRMLQDKKRLFGYRSPEYIKDVGTPERLAQVELDLASGRIQRSSLQETAPAVFLDRDGTLNAEKGGVRTQRDLELLPGVGGAIRRLNSSHFRTVVVTNQPVLAKGQCTPEELGRIHNKLETLLGRDGAYLDAIYYCPHHPEKGFPGERTELKVACSCRKPEPGLVKKATGDMNLDLRASWLIGDSTADVMAARNAGIKSILVRTGHAGTDEKYPVHADFESFDLAQAVEFILDVFPRMYEQAISIAEGVEPGYRIAIGGLARTGKSTWASVLRIAMQARGLGVTVVSLDSWLRNAADRGEGGVLGRYDIAAIRSFVSTVMDRTSRGSELTFSLPKYDRMTRTQCRRSQQITIRHSDVVILEGVVALLDEEILDWARLKLFVQASESARRRLFWKEYISRGFGAEEIEALYAERQCDEAPMVLESKARADEILQGVLE